MLKIFLKKATKGKNRLLFQSSNTHFTLLWDHITVISILIFFNSPTNIGFPIILAGQIHIHVVIFAKVEIKIHQTWNNNNTKSLFPYRKESEIATWEFKFFYNGHGVLPPKKNQLAKCQEAK